MKTFRGAQTASTEAGSHCLNPAFLPLLTVCVLSQSTLLRFQVALRGNCLKWALGCMHFPGLSHSGSGSGTPQRHRQCWAGVFVPFPGPSSSGNQVLGECTLPRWAVHLITSPVPAAQFPGCAEGVPSQVCHVSPLGS